MADRLYATQFLGTTTDVTLDLDKMSMLVPDENGKAVISMFGINNIPVEATHADLLAAWQAYANTP